MNRAVQPPIDASTRLLAVIGQPIHHSLSPLMHNAALAELGLNWRYMGLEVAPERLEQAIGGLAAIGCRGLSITIPHKERVQPLLSSIDGLARAVGAVNCLVPDECEIFADTIEILDIEDSDSDSESKHPDMSQEDVIDLTSDFMKNVHLRF